MDSLLRFDEFQERALYDPDQGFFAQHGSAGGRRGDFVTSVEVGPLFGAVIGRYLDAQWERLGRPNELWVYELGAGRGTLALSIRAGTPNCQAALRYVCIERSALLRDEQREQAAALSGVVVGNDADSLVCIDTTSGMEIHQRAELPDGPLVGVVLANELLDNVPTRILRGVASTTTDSFAASAHNDTNTFEELWVQPTDTGNEAVWFPLEVISAQYLDELQLSHFPVGAEFPFQEQAVALVHDMASRLEQGSLLFFDYMRETSDMATLDRSAWLRTYRNHERGVDPLEAVGSQDITCDVAVDQITTVLARATVSEQADWLATYGIDELVAEGKAAWHAAATAPTLAAMRGRSRVREAEALTDPSGLGGFGVIEWHPVTNT